MRRNQRRNNKTIKYDIMSNYIRRIRRLAPWAGAYILIIFDDYFYLHIKHIYLFFSINCQARYRSFAFKIVSVS